jgi:hypothetical protein
MTFQERWKNSEGRCKTISGEVRTSPHLQSKSGLGANKSQQLERGGALKKYRETKEGGL